MSDSLHPMDCSMPGFPVLHSLPELAQIHLHRVSDAIQPSHPLSSPFLLPSVFPSIRDFSNASVLLITWPKYWSFSFSISPSNEYSGLISFRIDWFDLLAVQGTLKSLLQHHILGYSFHTFLGKHFFSIEAGGHGCLFALTPCHGESFDHPLPFLFFLPRDSS